MHTMICCPVNLKSQSHLTPVRQDGEGGEGQCQEVRAGGPWLPVESQFHMNYLELKATFLTLQSFHNLLRGKHFRLLVDNSTGVARINLMGTSYSQSCSDITLAIWQWCVAHEV